MPREEALEKGKKKKKKKKNYLVKFLLISDTLEVEPVHLYF